MPARRRGLLERATEQQAELVDFVEAVALGADVAAGGRAPARAARRHAGRPRAGRQRAHSRAWVAGEWTRTRTGR